MKLCDLWYSLVEWYEDGFWQLYVGIVIGMAIMGALEFVK